MNRKLWHLYLCWWILILNRLLSLSCHLILIILLGYRLSYKIVKCALSLRILNLVFWSLNRLIAFTFWGLKNNLLLILILNKTCKFWSWFSFLCCSRLLKYWRFSLSYLSKCLKLLLFLLVFSLLNLSWRNRCKLFLLLSWFSFSRSYKLRLFYSRWCRIARLICLLKVKTNFLLLLWILGRLLIIDTSILAKQRSIGRVAYSKCSLSL